MKSWLLLYDYYYFVLSLLRQVLSPLWFAGPQAWLTPRAKWGTEKSIGPWTATQIWGLALPPTSWVSWLELITNLPESQFLTSRMRKQISTHQEEHTTTSWCDKALITVQNFSFCLGMTETLTIRKQAPWGPSCSFACKRKLLTDLPAHSKVKSKEDVIFYFSSCTKWKMICCIAPQSLMSASYSQLQIREWQIWNLPS